MNAHITREIGRLNVLKYSPSPVYNDWKIYFVGKQNSAKNSNEILLNRTIFFLAQQLQNNNNGEKPYVAFHLF